jgi:hypothetical protein
MVLNRRTNLFESTLEFKNTSNDPLTGDFSVVLKNLPSGIELSATYLGTALRVEKLGNGDKVITIPKSLLSSVAAGTKFKLVLKFSNPAKRAINFLTDLYSSK